MSSEGILSSSLAGKNDCELCEKSFTYRHDLLRHQRTIHREKFARTKLREKINWCHIKKYTPRLPLINSLTENVKMKPKFNPHLSLKKLNNHPTLSEKSHIKTQLSLLNIHDQKTLLIQMIMNNF